MTTPTSFRVAASSRRGGYRGRFAPSPTGLLHVGSVSTALCAWLAARSQRGTFIVRNEDLDLARVRSGAMDTILDDLKWLGLDWDEGPDVGGPCAPYEQSRRCDLYEAALRLLNRSGHTYVCDCSRAEIAASEGVRRAKDGSFIYPGTCRNKPSERPVRKPPAVRLAVPPGPRSDVSFSDLCLGSQHSRVATDVGDFVLRRADGVYAYQLAVVVDDLTQHVTQVVRGADLLDSTARQIFLMRMLGGEPPAYAHVPLFVAPDGSKLAKSENARAIQEYRRRGGDPLRLVASIAKALNLVDVSCQRVHPRELIAGFAWDKLPRSPVYAPW